jgi:hypothetical protein
MDTCRRAYRLGARQHRDWIRTVFLELVALDRSKKQEGHGG